MTPLSIGGALAVLGLLAKATLVLGVAGLVAAYLAHRGASAATRHLVWALAIGAVLALPGLSVVLPGWKVAVMTEAVPAPLPAPRVPAMAETEPVVQDIPRAAPAAASPEPAAPIPVEWIVAGIYALVALGLMARVAVGRWSVGRLAKSAVALDAPEWAEMLRDLSWVAGVDRPVRLLRSARATMPMTWGTRHPTVLVPAAADGWSAERRRVVLLHELAHVARRDCLAQSLAALACALYWIHPGVWYAAQRMRVERELACDDRVLAAGTRARSYAAHLLEVARAFRPAGGVSPVAVSMARPSHLEGRMLAVLDAVRSRRTPSRAVCAGAAAAALVLSVAIAAVHPAAATAFPGGREQAAPDQAARGSAEHVVEQSIAARPGGRLELVLEDDAKVEVVGWERATVFVRAEFTGERATDGEVDVVVNGGSVRLRASRASRAGRKDRIQVWVPSRFNVTVTSPGGGVSIRKVQGRFSGTSGGDGLHLAELRGTVDFATEGGGVMIARSRLDGEIRPSGAGVMMDRVSGDLNFVRAGTIVRGTVVEGSLEHEEPDHDEGPSQVLDCTSGTCTVVREHDGNGFAFVTGSGKERRAAVEALARNAPPAAAAEALARLAFQETDPEVQREAAESLASLPGEAGLAGLLKIARAHPGEEARREAAQGLGMLACDESIAALRQMAATDRDPGVQGEAVEALAGTLARDDLPVAIRDAVRAALREIARSHPNPEVRARARTETRDAPREMSAAPTGERLPLPAGARELALRNAAAPRGVDAAAIRDPHMAVRGAAQPAVARMRTARSRG